MPPAPCGQPPAPSYFVYDAVLNRKDRPLLDESAPLRALDIDEVTGLVDAGAMLLDGRYEAGIAAFHELDRDQHPDVANYLGYAHRKLGQYDQSKAWYEKALAGDPKHTRTLQYYGMWHLEQGNRLKAQDHLERIEVICGTGCEDYRLLRDAIVEGKTSY